MTKTVNDIIVSFLTKIAPVIIVLFVGFIIGYQFGVYSKNVEIKKIQEENELLKWIANTRK
jgi:hypothetical protein